MASRSLLQFIEQSTSMDRSISKDFEVIGQAFHHIGEHVYSEAILAFHFPSLGEIFQYLAVAAAIYLFIIDRTNWRTNILTALLVPYIFLNLPNLILGYVRSQIGAWIAFVALIIRLFFPNNIPPHTELPAALILLIVTAPKLLVGFRFEWPGEVVSILIGFYLLYEHIIHAGGFKQAFAERGAVITIGIVLLFVAPVFQLVGLLF
jgi:hypothetical protein